MFKENKRQRDLSASQEFQLNQTTCDAVQDIRGLNTTTEIVGMSAMNKTSNDFWSRPCKQDVLEDITADDDDMPMISSPTAARAKAHQAEKKGF